MVDIVVVLFDIENSFNVYFEFVYVLYILGFIGMFKGV